MYVSIKDLPTEQAGPIDNGNALAYPYYELLFSIIENRMKKPLIFKDDHGQLVCLEGRHRFHILSLLHQVDPVYFDKVVGGVDIEICDKTPFVSESPNSADASWLNMVERVRSIYAKLVH